MDERDIGSGDGEGDWRENRRLVASNFRQLFNRLDELIEKNDSQAVEFRRRFEEQSVEIATLKTDARRWGSIWGAIVGGAIAWLVSHFSEKAP